MAGEAGGNAAGNVQQQQRPQGGLLATIFRMGLMWYFFKQFGGKKGGPNGKDVQYLTPALERGTPVDVHFYVTDTTSSPIGWMNAAGSLQPTISIKNMKIGIGGAKTAEYTYRPSAEAKNNGSVLVHSVYTPHGASPNPTAPTFESSLTWGFTKQLNLYLPKLAGKSGVNLLSGKNATDVDGLDDQVAVNTTQEIISYLKPNVTISFVDDFSKVPSHQIPPHMMNIINVIPGKNMYTPHIYFNDFWLLRDYLIPLNETVTEQTITFIVEPIASWKAHLMAQMDNSFKLQEQWGMSSSSEADEVKRIFLEGNPIFLGLTVSVSMLHSVFDVLAFKNDIGFWKDNKSMKGLSARSIIINAVCQLIICLYLFDNETSTVVLISSFVGTLIEFWKVTKAMDVSVAQTASGMPYIRFKDKATYVQSQTDKYDAEAMRYLSYALYPLVGGYAVYALIYETHKSWYSWVLNSLVGAVYTFGFILMVPQLYLNYKLKSVAHLPWRQMTYKFLNTIIDDLFAFVIKMPLLHRLSVFRDDLVFAMYLYQRWIYRVDKSRVNEFGYVEEDTDKATTDEDQSQKKIVSNETAEGSEAKKDK